MVKKFSLILCFTLSNFMLKNVYCDELVDKDLKSKFLIFVEKEFLNYKVNIRKNNNNLIIYDENKKEYFVKLLFINENHQNGSQKQKFFIPFLKILDKNNIYLTSTRSVSISKQSDLLEIENASKALVTESINNLNIKKIYFSKIDKIIKDKSVKKIKFTLIGFSECENDVIIDIMEKEFPGYHHVEIGSSSTFKINSYNYFTNSTIQKIKKWVNIILFENNFYSKDYFSKVNKNTYDLVKVNKLKTLKACY